MVQNATLIRICATIGLVGAVFPVVADIISWSLAKDYNPIKDSISSLAVGPSSWLIDLGVKVFAASCIAVALGMWSLRPKAPLWGLALGALALVGVCAFIIAEVNEKPHSTLHLSTVLALAVLFPLAAFLAAPGVKTFSAHRARLSVGIGVAWLVLCPIYWFFTQQWSGAVERLVAMLMPVWLGMVAHTLRENARDRSWSAPQP